MTAQTTTQRVRVTALAALSVGPAGAGESAKTTVTFAPAGETMPAPGGIQWTLPAADAEMFAVHSEYDVTFAPAA